MTNAAKPLALLLALTLVVLICLVAMYLQASESEAIARHEAGKLETRLESLETELAAVKEFLNQTRGDDQGVRLTNNAQGTPTDPSELLQRVVQLEAQQLSTLTVMQNSGSATAPMLSSGKALAERQLALAALSARATAQDEKVAAAKAKLKEWLKALNVPDNIAALDNSTGMAKPSLVNYWPYFEAKQELEEALDFARLLKRKIQLEELDLGIETASQSGISQ